MGRHFVFEGHDTVELAAKYGTPLYIMSFDRIARSVSSIRRAFEISGLEYGINYAGKAFLNTAMCKIADILGINLDVVSGGELYTALQAGFRPERITMHGSNKSEREMREAVEAEVGTITIDSLYEIDVLNDIAQMLGKTQNVHLRLSPGVEAHTHEYVQTGRIDSKFGIPISMGARAARKTLEKSSLRLTGLHCHIGSQITNAKPFSIALAAMVEMCYNIKEMGCEISELNIGGGFGINYLADEPIFDVEDLFPRMASYLHEQAGALGIAIPKIIVEPGRYIVGKAGITLYTVGTIKEIPYLRKYVSVDGGMTDNPRPALYNAVHSACVANRYDEEPTDLVTISGKCCETDTLIKDVLLPVANPGDILAIMDTGAYNYSMASHYNRLPTPPVVLLSGERDDLIVRRDTYETLVVNDMVPSWLA
ncbi:MAG: diaminopimelate decarboxylase [Eubacteriaceae bacterium]|jgi:diaminopimelate decarboxylase|nr:diaminopimelate decarboxylase [Eubacteriaceae bacterium]